MDSKSLSHTKWKCQYHIVFIPKYRKKKLFGQLKCDVREILSTFILLEMNQSDPADYKIRKEISFGVNDSKEKRESDKEKFKAGKYMELKSVTFQHKDFEIDFGGVCINKD